MSYALLFPGQGAQEVGMGQDLAKAYPSARETFEAADEALGFSLSQIVFHGPEETLQETTYTQPAILVTGVALARALTEDLGVSLMPSFAAGHSLGEYTAHVMAGTLSLEDAVRLVHLRGRYMQEAVPLGEGSMAALLGLDPAAVPEVCQQAAEGQVCEAANFNAPGQVVISGHTAAVERAGGLAKKMGAKKVIPLNVSAPFHCSLMRPVAQRLAEAFEGVTWNDPSFPVVSNVSALPMDNQEDVRKALCAQTYSPVRWVESVETMVRAGTNTFLEFGPGNILSALVKKINKNAQTLSLRSGEELREAVDFLRGGQ